MVGNVRSHMMFRHRSSTFCYILNFTPNILNFPPNEEAKEIFEKLHVLFEMNEDWCIREPILAINKTKRLNKQPKILITVKLNTYC